jgi:Methylamine utilization protein MauJ
MNIAAKLSEPEDAIPAFRREIPDYDDVIKGELAQRGEWLVANISTNSFWPVSSQKVRWRGIDIWIMPIMKDYCPALAMKVPPGKSRADCEELMLRFLSTLSWVEERGFMVEGGGLSGGNLPRPLGRDKERGILICDEFDLSYFPEVTDEKAMLALGLMREGRSLNHVGYAFLSFYKILETAFPKDAKRIAWISASIAGLTGFGVKEALDGIRVQGITTSEEIGTHLFKSGRCAMAHGARKPIVDPDKPGDLRRLGSELPIVRALAAKAIEEVFGVETSGTNFDKHLYELHGFKKILGPDIVSHMQNGTAPAGQPTLEIPDISVRIRRKEHYAPFEGLRCRHVGHEGKMVYMFFESPQADVEFQFMLDFGAERIVFDLFADIGVRDTGTAESAERVHEVKRFQQDYFGNGQLHIVNADTGQLIGRKDPYIPLNMYLDHKRGAAVLAQWKALAGVRRGRDRKFAEEMERNARG